jgi:NTE family protein
MAKERALVLGGGGPVGIAWESGIAAGLKQGGVDLTIADFFIGTSAGSFVGSQLSGGRDPISLAEAQIGLGRGGNDSRQSRPGGPAPDMTALMRVMAKIPQDREPPLDVMKEVGAFSMGAVNALPEAEFIKTFGGIAREDTPWPERFACTAVDCENGEFKLWTHKDEIPLGHGVASSCSVPGIFAPIRIKDRLWMDGGMRSGTNADKAAAHKRVLIIAVVPAAGREASKPRLEREMAAIRAAGGEVELIIPDDTSAETFGVNLMNASRRADNTEAGMRQGRIEAERLKRFWS